MGTQVHRSCGSALLSFQACVVLAAHARADTHASFEAASGNDTGYVAQQHCGAVDVITTEDGSRPSSFLRLARHASAEAPTPHCNSISFDRSDPGLHARLDAGFDFRIGAAPGALAGDGFGFSLLDTAQYGMLGPVASDGGEDPAFVGSLSVGFDVFENEELPRAQEPSANHISVRFGDAYAAHAAIPEALLRLASGEWIHAQLHVEFAPVTDNVRLTLSAPSGVFEAAFSVPGLQPYESRVHIGARTGGAAADHDLDELQVTYGGAPEPAVYGAWSAPLSFSVVAIHMHLLPTGRVLFWDRGPWHPQDHNITNCADCDGAPRLWDPRDELAPPQMLHREGYDIFCSGHAFLPDGRLLVAGGHIADSVGSPNASLYDAVTNTWTETPVMNAGRWYPSAVTLSNGGVAVLEGEVQPQQANDVPQVYENGGWRTLDGANAPNIANVWYPFAFAVRDGGVFVAGPLPDAYLLDTRGAGAWTPLATSAYGMRDYGSAVMYEPFKVMIVGGSLQRETSTPTSTAELIDLEDRQGPAFHPTASMRYGRRQHIATLLPDGSVLVTGGSALAGANNALGAVHVAELWNPATGTWSTLAGPAIPRIYHSTALLLPDGRVLSAGGGHPSDAAHGDTDHMDAELFSPPYLQRGPRPLILAAPTTLQYGAGFHVAAELMQGAAQLTLLRLGSVTHAFDENQRFVRLESAAAGDGLDAQAPADPGAAPPGHYMLFVLVDGVPSEAQIVKLE